MSNNHSNHTPTDLEVQAILFQQGDSGAIAFFYNQFLPALSVFAYRWVKSHQVAQEIASEAFVKTWKMRWKLDSYSGIRAYLYTTVRRDSQKAQSRANRLVQIESLATPEISCTDTPYQQLIRAETYRIVHSALKDLPPGYRKVLTMHFIDGKSTGEIARELNAPVNTIKAQKLKGLKVLRKKLLHAILPLFYLTVKFSFFLW